MELRYTLGRWPPSLHSCCSPCTCQQTTQLHFCFFLTLFWGRLLSSSSRGPLGPWLAPWTPRLITGSVGSLREEGVLSFSDRILSPTGHPLGCSLIALPFFFPDPRPPGLPSRNSDRLVPIATCSCPSSSITRLFRERGLDLWAGLCFCRGEAFGLLLHESWMGFFCCANFLGESLRLSSIPRAISSSIPARDNAKVMMEQREGTEKVSQS